VSAEASCKSISTCEARTLADAMSYPERTSSSKRHRKTASDTVSSINSNWAAVTAASLFVCSAHAAGMAGGEVEAHGGTERHTRDVGLVDADRAEEGGDLVGMTVGRVRARRLVALAGAGKVDGYAGEVLGVGR
jgi:hypothetical protein